MKIVSGGQTGVDRAALDAGLALSIEIGGWCPQDRLAEDGVIPKKYPLQELPNSGYRQRTKQNVIDSDGTVVIYFGTPTGGTLLTIGFCMQQKKPHLLVDAETTTIEQASAQLSEFINQNSIHVLNVAGPRASGESGAYDYAHEVILSVFTS